MSRSISLGYLTVTGVSLPEHVSVAAENGYQAVSLRLQGARDAPEDWRNESLVREAELRLDDTGLSVLDCEIFRLMPETSVADSVGLFEVMQRLKSRLLLVLSVDPEPRRGFDTFVELCERSAPYGILACLEFSKITSVENLAQAVDIVHRSGQPNARVLVDALHLSRSGGTPADVAAVDPALFEFVQVCDAPAAVPNLEGMRLEPTDRLLPGQGGLPLADLLRALPAELPIAVEAPVKALEHLPPSERAWLAKEGLQSIFERS